MIRYFSYKRKSEHSNGRTNLIAVTTLLAILTCFLVFFGSKDLKQQNINSYCADFATLYLKIDSTFKLSYMGCGQMNLYLTGNWTTNGSVVKFQRDSSADNIELDNWLQLDDQYVIEEHKLLPMIDTLKLNFYNCKFMDELFASMENPDS
jgi:hypothetical protein